MYKRQVLTIDTSNNFGIGTQTPSNYYAKDLVVGAADEGGITIVNGTTEQGYLMFADGTGGSPDARFRGYIGYDHNIDHMQMTSGGISKFLVNNTTQAMYINSSGNVSIGGTETDYKLRVRGLSSGTGKVLIQTDGSFAGTDEAMLDFRHYDDTGDPGGRISFKGTTNYTGDMVFKVRGGGTSGAGGASLREIMRIDSLGRLQLGTDANMNRTRLATQRTTGCGTSATVIATVGTFTTYGGHYFITGRDANSSANRFCDQLVVGLNGSVVVLHSSTVRASPHSRSYDNSGENLRVTMGGGSYTIQVFCVDQLTN